MLKLEDIRFPITFTTTAGNITFSSPDKARWAEGVACSLDLAYCIQRVNRGDYQYCMAPAEKEPTKVYYRWMNSGAVSARFNSLAEAQAHATERAALYPSNGKVTIVREVAVVTAEIVQSSKVKVEYL